MGEQHLDAFTIAARLIEGFGLGQRPGYVASLLVDTTLDPAERQCSDSIAP